jgi:hypothetical protein
MEIFLSFALLMWSVAGTLMPMAAINGSVDSFEQPPSYVAAQSKYPGIISEEEAHSSRSGSISSGSLNDTIISCIYLH